MKCYPTLKLSARDPEYSGMIEKLLPSTGLARWGLFRNILEETQFTENALRTDDLDRLSTLAEEIIASHRELTKAEGSQ
jgi:hypothetical protein